MLIWSMMLYQKTIPGRAEVASLGLSGWFEAVLLIPMITVIYNHRI
jgi:hypothetical protein